MNITQQTLPEGWFMASPEEQSRLHAELQAEMPPGHALYGVRISIIAHRESATDDILCQHLDEPNHFSVVHLTWKMSREINSNHPSIECDGTYSDFVDYVNFYLR
ncbi:MAG: hypothetical protein JXR97_12790 [Planctomycetes bacterium]|nr:hypothetical protein [Planctomycetota bacterium]